MRYWSKIWLIVDRRNRLLHIDPNSKRVTMETIHRFKILPIRGILLLSRDTGRSREEERSIKLLTAWVSWRLHRWSGDEGMEVVTDSLCCWNGSREWIILTFENLQVIGHKVGLWLDEDMKERVELSGQIFRKASCGRNVRSYPVIMVKTHLLLSSLKVFTHMLWWDGKCNVIGWQRRIMAGH